jgi:hypothetical protein
LCQELVSANIEKSKCYTVNISEFLTHINSRKPRLEGGAAMKRMEKLLLDSKKLL